MNAPRNLSSRQAQIVLLAAQGLRYETIAARLGISLQTVKIHPRPPARSSACRTKRALRSICSKPLFMRLRTQKLHESSMETAWVKKCVLMAVY